MRYLPILFANLRRKKARTVLTVASFTVALFLFGILATIQESIAVGMSPAGADRMIVRNKTSIIVPLPFSTLERIRQVPGVKAASFATWFGGVYKDERNFFTQLAIDTERAREVFPEYRVPDEQWSAFVADREGCVAGRMTAERFGWKLGDRIPIRGAIYPGIWEFNLRAIYEGSSPQDDETQFWFQWALLEERRQHGKGTVGWCTLRVMDPGRGEEIAKAVDALFENSPYETSTETLSAFQAGFARQMGNIELLVLSIGGVVFFTLLLVAGGTAALSTRERTGELAVLQALGFSKAAILGLVLAEPFAQGLFGGALGIGLAKLYTLRGDPTHGLLRVFHLPSEALLWGFLIALAVSAAVGVSPALFAARLSVTDALRRA